MKSDLGELVKNSGLDLWNLWMQCTKTIRYRYFVSHWCICIVCTIEAVRKMFGLIGVLDLSPSNKQTQGAEVEDLWHQGHFIKSQSVLGGSVSLSIA